MNRFVDIERGVETGCERLDGGSLVVPNGETLVSSRRSIGTLIQVKNPTICSGEDEYGVMGEVLIMPVAELVKRIKKYYRTSEENIFPEIVDDYLFGGRRAALNRLRVFDSAKATRDLEMLSRIVVSQSQLEDIIAVVSVHPLILVTEFVKNAKRVSGEPLGVFRVPVAIVASEAVEFQLEHPSDVKTSDGRTESNPIFQMKNIALVIDSAENSVVQLRGGISNWRQAHLMEIFSAVLAIMGIVFAILPRLRVVALPVLVAAAGIFYLRYESRWGKNYFGYSEVKVRGDARMNFRFFATLA